MQHVEGACKERDSLDTILFSSCSSWYICFSTCVTSTELVIVSSVQLTLSAGPYCSIHLSYGPRHIKDATNCIVCYKGLSADRGLEGLGQYRWQAHSSKHVALCRPSVHPQQAETHEHTV